MHSRNSRTLVISVTGSLRSCRIARSTNGERLCPAPHCAHGGRIESHHCPDGEVTRISEGGGLDLVEGDRVRTGGPFREKLVTVPKGHIWLEGDNPNNSTDSRHYGTVPAALILGRVLLKVWPPEETGWVPGRPKASGEQA